MQNASSTNLPIRTMVVLAIIVVVALALWRVSSQFFYVLERVSPQEIGVQLRTGRITDVVGPGVYSAVGLFVELKRISTQAVPFTIEDDELITKDKQRIGLVVSGDIFRPNVEHADQIRQLWAQYNELYLNDEAARARITDRARQAMKVCVGDRTFDDAVIGTARDALRACIDTELDTLATNYGLFVQNVVVPDVIISEAVKVGLDAIVQRRLETEQAAQQKLKVVAEASAEQARQEGEIRIAQGRMQEEARQQTTLAKLDQEKIQAQRVVIEAERANELARVEAQKAIIEAEKANDLLAAQRELEIQTARALAASEQAKADTAVQAAQAALYSEFPGILQLQIALANASAIKATDKLIFTPEGTTPTIVLPGPGILPTVETTNQAEATK